MVVVAPHPDDESIGCGGLIAMLRQLDRPVSVLLLSDGAMSHPGSRRWPRPARACLRLAEFHAAVSALGVEAESTRALGWPDGSLPDEHRAGFHDAVAKMADCLEELAPTTLVVPWRRDPHPDHQAASAIARSANASLPVPARLLEYAVWAAERGCPADQPQCGEATCWSVDIASVVDLKLRAVAAHQSQLGGLIDDDPSGFVLSKEMLARCALPRETYYEVNV
ncbi:MAG: PIG-L deacetylase family protein [Caldimonas sp.]